MVIDREHLSFQCSFITENITPVTYLSENNSWICSEKGPESAETAEAAAIPDLLWPRQGANTSCHSKSFSCLCWVSPVSLVGPQQDKMHMSPDRCSVRKSVDKNFGRNYYPFALHLENSPAVCKSFWKYELKEHILLMELRSETWLFMTFQNFCSLRVHRKLDC